MNCEKKNALEILRSVFGYENFRNDVQEDAATAIIKGSEFTCISMPPGFGRSLCFQLPAILQTGKVVIVFSPKLSSIKRHVDFLRSKQINAHWLSKCMHIDKRNRIIRDLRSKCPTITLLYVTPEMAIIPFFELLLSELTAHNKLSYIVFNDAHCISTFGYEYNHNYRIVSNIEDLCENVPRIAITTTVTKKVIEDINNRLTLTEPKVFKLPVQEINVYYDIWFLDILSQPLDHLKSFIFKMLGFLESINHKKFRWHAIIYCRDYVTAELLSDQLNASGLPTLSYHYKLKASSKRGVEQKWLAGDACVITTTYNYGFMYRKPIRCTIYWTIPENISKYYREAAQMHSVDKAYCRIYFSAKEYSSVRSLIDSYNQTDDTEIRINRLSEYEKFVSYCLSVKCRHAIISQYFGRIIPSCQTNCDVCETKDIVEIRTCKFITYSEAMEKVKYNICEISGDSPSKLTDLSSSINSEEQDMFQSDSKELGISINAEANDTDERIMEDNYKLEIVNQTPSAVENSSFDTRENCETSFQIIDCMKENIDSMYVEIIGTVGSLENKDWSIDRSNRKVNTAEIAASKRNVIWNTTKKGSKIKTWNGKSVPENKSKVEVLSNADKAMKEKNDRVSKKDLHKIVVTEETRQDKNFKKRVLHVETCTDHLRIKRRKLSGVDNKVRTIIDKRVTNRNQRAEHIKDDANESKKLVERLMKEYNLNNQCITLEIRKK